MNPNLKDEFGYDSMNSAQLVGKIQKLEEEMLAVKMENVELKEETSELRKRIDELALTEQIDGITWLKFDGKEFESNPTFGSKLVISEGGSIVKHSGPNGWNCVRSLLAIPKFNLENVSKPIIAFYFEMEILNGRGPKIIGFCDEKFAMDNNQLGNEDNSIGFGSQFAIVIDGFWTEFGDDNALFTKGDFAGIGIIYQPNEEMECFATLNGKLFGKVALPPKYANINLFPAINLTNKGNSIRVHFDKEEWLFKDFKNVI